MAGACPPRLQMSALLMEKEGAGELAGRAVGFTGRPHVDD